LKYIKKKIIEYKINENIKILDYVEDEELLILYKLCKALVMPTYFGPTNIPPVEAWYLDVPVVYSTNLKNHGKEAALYFSPDSEDELIHQLKNLDSLSVKKNLVLNGQKRLKEIIKERNENIEKFIKEIAIMKSNI
jgi:glycosyltransferase involved in cell wall biosynthesis